MSRVSSIPSEHEQRIVNWWVFGSSPREIAARLLEEHAIDTSHASVQRLIDRVSQGHPGAALSALKARLRLEAGQIATDLADVRARVLFVAGVTPGSTQVGSVEALRELRGLEIADRVLHRKLKVAGVESPDTDAEREHRARVARASTLAGVRDGLDWCLEPELGRPGAALPAAASESPGVAAPAAAASLESVRLEPSQPLESQEIESYAPLAPDGAAGHGVPAANEDLEGRSTPGSQSPRPGGDPLPNADVKPAAPPAPVPPAARRRPANVTEGLLWAKQAEEERLRLGGSLPSQPDPARPAAAPPVPELAARGAAASSLRNPSARGAAR